MFHAVVVLLFLQFVKVSRIHLIWCKSSARLIGVVLKMTGLLVTKAGYLCCTGFHVVFIHAAIEYALLICCPNTERLSDHQTSVALDGFDTVMILTSQGYTTSVLT